jgi:hypothetical protein
MRKLVTLCMIAGVVASTACGTKEAAGPLEPTGPTGRIRFVNLITNTTRVPVNAILENVPFGVNLAYGGTTPSSLPSPSTANYSAILAGARTLVLKKTADTATTVATLPLTITASQDVTVYATGGAGTSAVTSFITIDDNTAPSATQVRLRAVNIAPAGGALDVFVTAPNADLSTATPTFATVGVKATSAYANLAPGTYQIRTVPAGTVAASRAAAVSFNMTDVALTGGTGRTILIADKSTGGTPLVGFILPDR